MGALYKVLILITCWCYASVAYSQKADISFFEKLNTQLRNRPVLVKQKLDSVAPQIHPKHPFYHYYMHSLSRCQLVLGDYDLALKTAREGEDNLTNDTSFHRAIYLKNQGAALYYLRKREEAIFSFKQGVQYGLNLNIPKKYISELYNNLGALYAETRILDSARYYLSKAIEIEKQLYVNTPEKRSSLPYRLLGTTYYMEQDYTEARVKLGEAFNVALASKDTVQIVGAQLFYGDVLLKLNLTDSAIYYYHKSELLSKKSVVPDLKLEVAKHQLDGFEKAGLLDSALLASRKIQQLQLDLYAAEMAKKVGEMEVKYETAQLKQQNLLKEVELKTEKARTRQFILIAIIAFMLLVLVGFIAVYFYHKRKSELKQQKQNTIIRLQDERLRISKDLHDNIGAQITVITSTLDQMEWQLDTENALGKHIGQLSDYSRQTMNDLRETVWAMKQDHIMASDLASRMQQFISKIGDLHPAMQIDLNCQGNEKIEWEPRASLNLMRIVQEAIQNSLKHSNTKQLELHIDLSSKQWQVKIKDFGCGFSPDDKVHGNGLLHMQERARNSNFDFSLHSKPGIGTQITISKAA